MKKIIISFLCVSTIAVYAMEPNDNREKKDDKKGGKEKKIILPHYNRTGQKTASSQAQQILGYLKKEMPKKNYDSCP